MTVMVGELMEKGRLCSIEVAQLALHPLNRKRLGDMEEFTNDVRLNGVEVPIIVRGIPGEWQVLAGARRVTAAETIGLERIPAVQVELDDDDAFQFMMRENMQRENVHPLDEARYFEQCSADGGQNLEDLVVLSGKSKAYVHRRLRLLRLVPAIAKAYEAGKLSHGIAMTIATLTPEVQKELHKWIEDQSRWEGEVGPGQVRDWIARQLVLSLGEAPFDTTSSALWTAAGACTLCPKRTGNTPTLFGELDDKDACTDPKCWEQKTAKHIDAQIAAWKKDGTEWTPLANFHQPNSTMKYEGREIVFGYQKCGKASGKLGMVVRGGPPNLGTVLYWKKQSFGGGGRMQRTPQEIAAARRVKRQQNVKGEFRNLVFDEVSKHKPTTADDWRFIALNVFDGLWQESRKKIAKRLGWELVKQKHYDGMDHYATAVKRLAPMGVAELQRFIHSCAIVKEVDRGMGYRGKDHLLDRAKTLKIKTPAMQKKADAKFPPVKTPKKKAATKATKKKATTTTKPARKATPHAQRRKAKRKQ